MPSTTDRLSQLLIKNEIISEKQQEDVQQKDQDRYGFLGFYLAENTQETHQSRISLFHGCLPPTGSTTLPVRSYHWILLTSPI